MSRGYRPHDGFWSRAAITLWLVLWLILVSRFAGERLGWW